MKRKQITKLFAVMAMAASPAAGSPVAQPDPWATSATVTSLDARDASVAMAAVISIGYAALAQPRMLESGAPTTGNIRSRPLLATEAAAPTPMIAARPRTTPSGAPACGNVASRAPRPAECAPRGAVILADVPASAPQPIVASVPK